MRTVAILVAILMLAAIAGAATYEIDKGAVQLGGMVGFSSAGGDLYENVDGDAQTEFTISPEALYFITKGLGIGGTIQFSSASQGDDKTSALGIGPAVRYYFGNNASKVFPFLGASFMYSSNKFEDADGDLTINGTTIEFLGGAFFKLVEHFGVEGALFLDLDNLKADIEGAESTSGSVFGVRVGVTGFLY